MANLGVNQDLKKALRGVDAVIFAVRHKLFLDLNSDEVVETVGGPIGVIDCFGILDEYRIKQYFELVCEVKGLGRGHMKRIKGQVGGEREGMYPQMGQKAGFKGVGKKS
ncbi:MAG: hypothetical protein HWN51_07065 [Desulfobacterales bacterium]|nr:hypothetical protein [Desulfobacterales bacterium]